MSKTEKRVQLWLKNAPTESPIDHVIAILERYFPDGIVTKGGSHITVKDKRLAGMKEFGPLGHLVIPEKGGQRVKREYLKKKRVFRLLNLLPPTKKKNPSVRKLLKKDQ